jgi:hypothetical protein
MSDRLEDRIRRGAERMYQGSNPVENLMPPDLARRAGKPIPEIPTTGLSPPTRSPQHQRWLAGLAAAAVVALIALPLLFLVDQTDQKPAAPSETPTRSVVALFEGNSEGFRYRISVFAGQPEDGQASPANSSVEVEIYSDPTDIDPAFECFAPEKTLDASSRIRIDERSATASFVGEYDDSPCFFENADFDLKWTGQGELVNEAYERPDAGEICRERYAAATSGTVQFSSGPITVPITVVSNDAMIITAEETPCLTPNER